ncbi:MAG: hypothetical protein JRE92_04665 [Deltaproteobacteria bacterium]|jgi:uncharacterized membrane protein|nr:hypothetical protein [Deltaproteobacteria bacterium]
MRHKILAILLAMFFLVAFLGCGGYYMVKDPASGSVYYTTKIKDERGGSVKFEDKKTQTSVTLQNSEVKKISKKEFKSALEAKEAPETKEAAEMKEATEAKEATESKPVKE